MSVGRDTGPVDRTALESSVREYWDENVANWKIAAGLEVGSPDFFAEVERYRFEKLDYLERRIDFSAHADQRLLDVGCGLGTDASRFARGGARVVGVDIAPEAIRLARENFHQRGLAGEFVVMNGERLAFPDASFDFVYCHTVLHFTMEPARMIGEIARVLRPGGQALLMSINRHSWMYALHRLFGVELDYPDAPVFHRFSPAEFDALTGAVFERRELVIERFPVRTEVHHGWKALAYNRLFVDLYRALPARLIEKTGYHLLAFVTKPIPQTSE